MTHNPVSTGAGYHCTRCKLAWDQGEPEPPDCVGGRVQPLAPFEPKLIEPPIDFSPQIRTLQRMDQPNPLATQVGGAHYKRFAIQPTEFCMKNRLDPCIHAVLKYVARWRVKNGLEDLRKAAHYVQIREAFAYDLPEPGAIQISMLEFVTRNNIPLADADVLYRLEAYYNALTGRREGASTRLITAIDDLIKSQAQGVPMGSTRPYPDLLNAGERADLLSQAEQLWRDLQANDLGGFSGINRPFYILNRFEGVIEQFGGRDVGLQWSKNQLDNHPDRPK